MLCSKCNAEISPLRASGLCLKCYNREYRRKRREDPEYREREREKRQARRKPKPPRKATGLIKGMTKAEYERQWRRKHPEAACSDISRVHKWREKNRERFAEYQHQWRQENRERINAYQRRRLRHKAVEAKRAQGEIICYWCKGPIPEHRIKKCARNNPPKFCSRAHFLEDLHEKQLSTGYYAKFSKMGNDTQSRIEAVTGERPGHDKRVQNMKKIRQLRQASVDVSAIEIQQELDADPGTPQ
jgi:hypothetical protein